MRLTKGELVARINARACAKYGQAFSQALLDDLIKDGLMPAATRAGNAGRRPLYVYDAKAYRRGLQVMRLYSAGTIDRDAVKVQLFVWGYSLPAYDVREALWAEFRAHIAKLLASTRSRYLDNDRAIPPAHQRSLDRSMGPLDPDLDAAGFRLPSEDYLQFLRLAKSGSVVSTVMPTDPVALAQMILGDQPWSEIANKMLPAISGLMQIEPPDGHDRSTEIDYVEKKILQSSDKDLETARAWIVTQRLVVRRFPEFNDALGFTQTNPPDSLLNKLIASARRPEWTALIMVIALIFQSNFPIVPDTEEALKMLDYFSQDGFTLRDLLTSMDL